MGKGICEQLRETQKFINNNFNSQLALLNLDMKSSRKGAKTQR